MKKWCRRLLCVGAAAALVWCGSVVLDRQRLNRDLIRLHVVANSDSEADQQIKLQVRDALTAQLRQDLDGVTDVSQAMACLSCRLPELEQLANTVLDAMGVADRAAVRLDREPFPTRDYETFSLPAGVYQALRVTIGKGEGHNWWCVVFPQLCLPAAEESVEAAAEEAGFDDPLTGAITGRTPYRFRFFLLDWLGKGENLLFAGN